MEIEKVKCYPINGRGIGKRLIERINTKLGDDKEFFFPGTFNVYSKEPVYFLKSKADIVIDGRYFLFKINLEGVNCYIIRWVKCPGHIFEIVSSEKLKDLISFENVIEISFSFDKIIKTENLNSLLWFFFWKFRENWYYKSNLYSKVVGKFIDFRYKFLNYDLII